MKPHMKKIVVTTASAVRWLAVLVCMRNPGFGVRGRTITR